MTTDDREFWLATTDWLEAGSDETPPAAVDAVLLAVRTTRQERVLRSPWRPIPMSAFAKIAIAAAAVVAVALVWVNFGPSNNVGTNPPSPTPTGTPYPSPAALPTADAPSAIAAGRYVFAPHWPNPAISFTVPASGWTGNVRLIGKNARVAQGPTADGAWMLAYPFDHGFKDPCTDHTAVVPAAGSGPAGLLNVIGHQPGISAGAITDVSVGGIAGKALDYTVTADPTNCGNGQDGFWIWGTCPAPVTVGCEDVGNGDRRYGVGKGARERAYAIPVGSNIYTFVTNQPDDLSPADRGQLQQLLDSIVFGPPS
jgi:hypothetical protein